MPLRYPNIEELEFLIPNVQMHTGADIDLMGMPFNGEVVGFRAALKTAVTAATDVTIKIQTAANVDLTNSVNFAAADAVGTIFGASGNNVKVPRGTRLVMDAVENGAVAAGAADLYLLLRKSEPGQIFDGIPRT